MAIRSEWIANIVLTRLATVFQFFDPFYWFSGELKSCLFWK
ncbi:hypothetical protein AQPE_1890 [Aquipluma nitroreducens]|uniref:Uncharacterized protein n=1 Tax=Aquipluma nitroreducens TaxID=2010828 RepID=A0A5K7S854_9BACT|nr:hypothetical protein AQPE_1890 [Aquipluma nitroreducens]